MDSHEDACDDQGPLRSIDEPEDDTHLHSDRQSQTNLDVPSVGYLAATSRLCQPGFSRRQGNDRSTLAFHVAEALMASLIASPPVKGVCLWLVDARLGSRR